MKVRVKCIETYKDKKLNKMIQKGKEFIIESERAKELEKEKVVEILGAVKEEKIETAKQPEQSEKAVKETKVVSKKKDKK